MNDIHAILKKMDAIGAGMSFSYDYRKGGAGALFDLAHEHAKSIAVLIDSKLTGSAFALLRPCIEAYVRGDWLLHCASYEQVELFTNRDSQWPSLSKQMYDLENYDQFSGSFKRYKGRAMGRLNALTHGLSSQIKMRFNGSYMESAITDTDIKELVWEISFISILSHLGIAEISEDQSVVSEIEQAFEELKTLTRKPGPPSVP